MATVIDFTAKLNERRASAKQAEIEQTRQTLIDSHMDTARNAAVSGDAKSMIQHVVAAVEVQEKETAWMPAYCDPSNEYRGSKYASSKGLYTTDLAALMRKDIKAAFSRGQLPKGLKISVRCKSYSGGSSIDMDITGLPKNWTLYNPEYLRWTGNLKHDVRWPEGYECDWRLATQRDVPGGMWSEGVKNCLAVLKEIHDAYQRDNSDSMSDYFDRRYYGDVGVKWDFEYAVNQRIKEAGKE